MGLIQAAIDAVGGALADQWLEYFVCDSMEADVLVTKGQKKAGKRSSNTKGEEDVISNGSGIVVNKGQAAIIIADGKVADICAEEGTYTFEAGTEPSVFYGGFGAGLKGMLASMGDRIKHGGIPAKQHRIYYFNTKEILDNKFGTQTPIPFLMVIDQKIDLKLDISVRCNGVYTYRIVNPAAFYGVCGNVTESYTRDKLDNQFRSDILDSLHDAFGMFSEQGLRYSAIPAHKKEMKDKLNELMAPKWREGRGIEIGDININSISVPKEDEERIKQMQYTVAMRDPTLAAANLAGAQADAMKLAASNTSGAAMAFMGMGMAGQAGGMNAGNLYAMGAQQQQQAPQQQAPAGGWDCSCGHKANTGKFCAECGKGKPESAAGWTCECGTVNGGKFCANCGKPKPSGALLYRCDKCGWEPADPKNVPKFCPECGDVFDENDIKK
jgi:membrane protease subunit (stomatin/prohibitin family)